MIRQTVVSLGVAWATAAGCATAEPIVLRAGGASVALGREEKGAVVSLRAAGGAELAARAPKAPGLFTLFVARRAAPAAEAVALSSAGAPRFGAQVAEAGGGTCATLTYEGFTSGVSRVVCTVRTRPGDALARWGIAVEVQDGYVLEGVQYPVIALAAALGAGADDDAVVLGTAKGGVIRRPEAMKPGSVLSGSQPGNLAAQFGCYYDGRAGFYFAAEDGQGYPKELRVARTAAGVEFSWTRSCCAEGADAQAYEAVTGVFGGAGGEPADWRDAADLYKAWAEKQPWCGARFAQRRDVPGWLRDGPAMVRFSRDWLAEPARIEQWLAEYWLKSFPQAPLITAYWGWEKRGSWVTPDYFPLYPSDAAFTNVVAKTRKLGCHAFPWPSGYHWTLTYDKRPDGRFEWDDRARFDAVARPHAVHNRDGSLYIRTPSWLRGGDTACLCGGDPWTVRWWNDEICVPLARRGCELIQVDQVVGANWPACYAPGHGHPKRRGLWMTEAFTRQLLTMRDAMRAHEPDAVVCFEEPNEWYNHIVGLQDYRDCEAKPEWASVFNYLYHEYLPCFQSNPHGGDRVMAAHCAADGQMPHLVPSGRDLDEEVLVNGGFEARGAGGGELRGWEQVRGYQGVEWKGQAARDDAEKHGGAASLRLENASDGDIVQVSQNVSVDDRGFAAGGRYRLSAWLKTERQAQRNAVGFGVFAPGLRSTGQGGQLAFPEPEAGWVRASADFMVPPGAEMLRIMCNARGAARVWVDDVTLEALAPDGGAREVRLSGLSSDARFMRKWVALYHGEGQPWLMHGRLLHPPKLLCASVGYRDRQAPAVFHNAFRAPGGVGGGVVATATRDPQQVTLVQEGRERAVALSAHDIVLLK